MKEPCIGLLFFFKKLRIYDGFLLNLRMALKNKNLSMTTKERIAIARIFSDLIKADRIVDTGEMEYWAKICSKYSITKDMEIRAQEITFSAALSTIRNSEYTESKKAFLEDCRSMTTSDGFCAHSEALIMIAIILMLEEDCPFRVETISIPRSSLNIDVATALYIEDDFDAEVNEAIEKCYRMIYKEFQLAGFHFIYLPNIIDHYRNTESSMFKRILSFLAPSIGAGEIDGIYDSIMKMTTGSFCKDILCNRLEIKELRNTYPSLLIKTSNDYVGETQYANYLKIEVGDDIFETVKGFIDAFCDMLSSDVYVVNSSEERDNQFHYHGFYKQLLDIFLFRKDIRSKIVLCPYANTIKFPDISSTAEGMHRRERALYALLLCAGSSGIDFRNPGTSAGKERYESRMKKLQAQYNVIYGMFSGDNAAPDLSNPKIRGPIVACMKKSIQRLRGLYNQDDYNVTRDNGILSVHIDPELVFMESMDGTVPLLESELYRRYKEVR